LLLFAFCVGATNAPVFASNIGDLTSVTAWGQTLEFWSLREPSVRYAILSALCLGVTCGVLGSLMTVRRMALVGDALGHAVLPGVAVGFLLAGTKASPLLMLCAVGSGMLGIYTMTAISRTTRIKPDASMALVLSCFFGMGVSLVTWINQQPGGNKSGLSSFLFGQAAAVGPDELKVMALCTLAVLLIVAVLYKELQVFCFDEAYAASLGLPVRLLHHLLLVLLAVSVVVSIQAVGVILVAAMLVIPAATAYLLCERLHRMLLVAAATGCCAGVLGTYLSYLGTSLPTGPFMVMAAAGLFTAAWMLGPRHGVLRRWWRLRLTRTRAEMENTMKALWQIRERTGFTEETVPLAALASQLRTTEPEAAARVEVLAKRGWAVAVAEGGSQLTRDGHLRACEVVRNHRLWELYLVTHANVAPDQVHEDAERIEHVLGAELVAQLERRLSYPRYDPHGRPIPSLRDLELAEIVASQPPRAPHEVLLGRYRSTSERLPR